jgi:hypothetical protein
VRTIDEIRARRRQIADLLTLRWETGRPTDDLREEVRELNREEKAYWAAKRAAEHPSAAQFTDAEYAVIYDSLVEVRDRLREEGVPTPNIESALAKLGRMARPEGCEFIAFWGQDRQLLADTLMK